MKQLISCILLIMLGTSVIAADLQNSSEREAPSFSFDLLPSFNRIFTHYGIDKIEAYDAVLNKLSYPVNRQPHQAIYGFGSLTVNTFIISRANNDNLFNPTTGKMIEYARYSRIRESQISGAYEIRRLGNQKDWGLAEIMLQDFLADIQIELFSENRYGTLTLLQIAVWSELLNKLSFMVQSGTPADSYDAIDMVGFSRNLQSNLLSVKEDPLFERINFQELYNELREVSEIVIKNRLTINDFKKLQTLTEKIKLKFY